MSRRSSPPRRGGPQGGRRASRGTIILLALAVTFILMMWAVAAVYRANFVSGAVLFSYRKSEASYLAKRALSRSLYLLNKSSAWATAHNSKATADNSTPGTLCWLEPGSSATTRNLRCEAIVEGHVEMRTVPIQRQTPSSLHIFTVAPSLAGGPDMLAWCSQTAPGWESLPAIPGAEKVLSVAATPKGDICCIVENPDGETVLWRYRLGRGWQQMPDAPEGVKLSHLTAGGGDSLVCLGSNNAAMVLKTDPMGWTEVPAPSGKTLTNLAAHPTDSQYGYATVATGTGTAGVSQVNLSTGQWADFPAPGPPSGLDLSGGVTADKSGNVYVGENPAAGPAIVHAYRPPAPGDVTGTWTSLPTIPALEWQGGVATSTGEASGIKNLKADNEGKLWVQWESPTTGKVSIISLPGLP